MTTPGFHESIAADETSRFEGYARELKAIAAESAERRKAKPGRALHLKQHVGAVGELVVDAPEKLRAGIFQQKATYPVYVRFSNGSAGHQSDKAPDARGFALKIVGVPGKKIIPGLEDKKTQDFLFIATPSLPFKTPDEFMAFVRAARGGPALLVPKLFLGLGLRTFSVLPRLAKSPQVTSFATLPFHTAAPIAWGDSAAKLSLVPVSTGSAAVPVGDNHLGDDMIARLKAGPLVWSLRAQPFVDDATTPIEDASVTWPEDKSPPVEVGRLTLPQQDPRSPTGKQIGELIETLSFDPWHAVEAHRPLGAVMRARAVAYRESVIARGAAPEPESVLPL